ncbi:hypothetical protein BDQ12DRAFT_722817 [Crucibulum laeve]|uniref:Uncharacterized protein n=1 Tax=Crucibulum laeve TaxID=68775 RepID=A0A5C3M1F0_9AGAR|nr:hypothetical protein BDQ12DRAFT_722817 [Crucibulum laeve]
MALKHLNILKKDFNKLLENIKDRRDKLNAKLSQGESISSSGKEWLDHEGNTIDEQCILDALESASDYERGWERLDEAGKGIVKRLREWAGDLVKETGNRQKHKILYI